MVQQESGKVAARGGEIAYHAAGDGPLVAYLHGAGGLRWGAALDGLAERFRVCAIDLPGFGGSTLPDDVNGIPEAAEMVAAAMAEIGRGERMHLVGTSLGGRVATWLAVLHPERIARLVLESPAAFRPPDARPLGAFSPEEMRRVLYGDTPGPTLTDDPAERQRQLKVVGRLTQGIGWDAECGRSRRPR
jgi:pimeloyl-ACP methyl ester carboxylesterase